jgi:hypothetical protein
MPKSAGGAGVRKGDNGKSRLNVHSGGTGLPYGFDLQEIRRGSNALPYADGSVSNFHRCLSLGKPMDSYVSKALRTLGFLDRGRRSELGEQYVNAPTKARRAAIIARALLNYPPYRGAIATCDVDPSLQRSVSFKWVAEKLAAEKRVSKDVARRAAHAFGTLITEAGFGNVAGQGNSKSINWIVVILPLSVSHS